jgi:hypothetical protein
VKVFRKYLTDKLSDPDFSAAYHHNCAVCPITVRIVAAVSASRDSMEHIASQCGITVQTIEDLKTADKCCIASVKKLCDHFGFPPPVDTLCLQRKKPL